MRKQPNLILPKNVTLLSEGPPRVLLSGGRRYTEKENSNGSSQTVFVAEDGESLSQATLRIMADAERRREFRGDQESGEPATNENDIAFLRSEFARLQLENDTAAERGEQIVAARMTAQARIEALELEVAQLRRVPERVELDTLRTRCEGAESNINILERLCGIRGIDPASAIAASHAPTVSKSLKNYTDELARAETAEQQDMVLTEFQAAVKAGTIKSESSARGI